MQVLANMFVAKARTQLRRRNFSTRLNIAFISGEKRSRCQGWATVNTRFGPMNEAV